MRKIRGFPTLSGNYTPVRRIHPFLFLLKRGDTMEVGNSRISTAVDFAHRGSGEEGGKKIISQIWQNLEKG